MDVEKEKLQLEQEENKKLKLEQEQEEKRLQRGQEEKRLQREHKLKQQEYYEHREQEHQQLELEMKWIELGLPPVAARADDSHPTSTFRIDTMGQAYSQVQRTRHRVIFGVWNHSTAEPVSWGQIHRYLTGSPDRKSTESLYGAFRSGLSGLSETQRGITYGLRHSPRSLSEEVP